MSFESDLYGLIYHYKNYAKLDDSIISVSLSEASLLLALYPYAKPDQPETANYNDAISESNKVQLQIIDLLSEVSKKGNVSVPEAAATILNDKLSKGSSGIMDQVRTQFQEELFLHEHPIWKNIGEV